MPNPPQAKSIGRANPEDRGEDPRVALALQTVSDAGLLCRGLQRTLDLSRPISKSDGTPVTIADLAAQALIVHRLDAVLGSTPILAEETAAPLRGSDAESARKTALAALRQFWPRVTEKAMLDAIDRGGLLAAAGQPDRPPSTYWTLDPIDGTRGFLRGQQFAVCLALVERGRPTISAMACPNLSPDPIDALATTIDPRGCSYAGDARAAHGLLTGDVPATDAPPRLIQRVPDKDPGPLTELVVCASHVLSDTALDRLHRALAPLGRPFRILRLDSQCKYCIVARGQAHAFLRLPSRGDIHYHVWDHIPGAAIAAAAGCTVSDVRGLPLDPTTGPSLLRNVGVVCAAPWLHGPLIDSIRSAGVAPA